jgi:hypothetical protein
MLYFVGLVKHPPQKSLLRPIGYFTECTRLFPDANVYAIEYRLDAWSCDAHRWLPLDPRPYFPIEADDKESRFQRLGYFYGERAAGQTRRTVMTALDDYVMAHHDDVADGVPGALGGIRFYKVARTLPEPGEPVARYAYSPLTPPPTDAKRTDLFYTRASTRKARCKTLILQENSSPAEGEP